MNSNTLALLLTAAICILIVLAWVAWYYFYRKPRDQNAPHRLGKEMGLRQLNEGSRDTPVWYAGRYADHDFGLTYANLRYGSYGPKHARTVEEVILSLRVAVALNVAEAQDIIAYFHHGRPYEPGLKPEDFEDAFDRRNTDRLNQQSRDALLYFTQNYGSLRLRDRATAPAALFADEALAGAQVVLVHDRRGYKQSPEQVYVLLDALVEVAKHLEADPAFESVRSSI